MLRLKVYVLKGTPKDVWNIVAERERAGQVVGVLEFSQPFTVDGAESMRFGIVWKQLVFDELGWTRLGGVGV